MSSVRVDSKGEMWISGEEGMFDRPVDKVFVEELIEQAREFAYMRSGGARKKPGLCTRRFG